MSDHPQTKIDPTLAQTRAAMPPYGPVLKWPCTWPLQPLICEMQRLNPSLGLRRAASTWVPDYTKLDPRAAARMRADIDGDDESSEYLVHTGSALDVLTIVMPEVPDDDAMSGLSECNRERGRERTDLGRYQCGPRRVERTAEGNLLLRPRSPVIEDANARFAFAYQDHNSSREERAPIDQILRFQSRWGIFRSEHELWEVDFAYHAADYLRDGPRGNHDFWRSTPVGTVSYIDRYDLPIAEHYVRAQAIVEAGSEFAIVGDVEIGEAFVFRAGRVDRYTEPFRLSEIPWFLVPIADSITGIVKP